MHTTMQIKEPHDLWKLMLRNTFPSLLIKFGKDKKFSFQDVNSAVNEKSTVLSNGLRKCHQNHRHKKPTLIWHGNKEIY